MLDQSMHSTSYAFTKTFVSFADSVDWPWNRQLASRRRMSPASVIRINSGAAIVIMVSCTIRPPCPLTTIMHHRRAPWPGSPSPCWCSSCWHPVSSRVRPPWIIRSTLSSGHHHLPTGHPTPRPAKTWDRVFRILHLHGQWRALGLLLFDVANGARIARRNNTVLPCFHSNRM